MREKEKDEKKRSDFLYIEKGMEGVVGVGGMDWKFIEKMSKED